MGGFAVDDGGDAIGGVSADPAPDFHHIAAGGVDDAAAAGFDFVDELGGCAEGGDNDDVVLGELVVFGGEFLPWEGDDVHFPEVLVDFRVVDDFADEEDAFVGEDAAGGVGEVDGTFDAVAEAELFGEEDGGVADGEASALAAEFFDE